MSNRVLEMAEENSRLVRENAGLKAKLADFKAFRANYQRMRAVFKMEQKLRFHENRLFAKALKALRNIADDTADHDSYYLRNYAARMLTAIENAEEPKA